MWIIYSVWKFAHKRLLSYLRYIPRGMASDSKFLSCFKRCQAHRNILKFSDNLDECLEGENVTNVACKASSGLGLHLMEFAYRPIYVFYAINKIISSLFLPVVLPNTFCITTFMMSANVKCIKKRCNNTWHTHFKTVQLFRRFEHY